MPGFHLHWHHVNLSCANIFSSCVTVSITPGSAKPACLLCVTVSDQRTVSTGSGQQRCGAAHDASVVVRNTWRTVHVGRSYLSTAASSATTAPPAAVRAATERLVVHCRHHCWHHTWSVRLVVSLLPDLSVKVKVNVNLYSASSWEPHL